MFSRFKQNFMGHRRVLVSAPHPASQARGPVPAPGPQRGLGGGGAVTDNHQLSVNVSNVFH